jgi:dipeptidyl aminopeptidase/acylaminoacyl peptidase
LAWHLEQGLAPAIYDLSRQVVTIGNLAISHGGELIARRLSRRDRTGEGSRASLEIFDAKGRIVAAALEGDSARPIAFSPDGKQLLISRSGTEGRDLVLWTAPAGPCRVILQDEPDLGRVRFSGDGQYLLVASSRGAKRDDPEADAPRWRRFLREKLPDYVPLVHLHLVDVSTGMRRQLTAPGDYVLDDAVFLPNGQRIIYGRTVPQVERPWFRTEIRLMDLASSQDQLLTTFVAGWEVRPQNFAISFDGRHLAFLGPPDQITGGGTEHNVYNKKVWLLELESGVLERITRGMPHSFGGGNNLPGWDRQDALIVQVNHGSASSLGRLYKQGSTWQVDVLPMDGLSIEEAALACDGSAAVLIASAPAAPPALYGLDTRKRAGRGPRLVEAANADLITTWQLASPADASCLGPGGELINAWWYAPSVKVSTDPLTPLILYYYGGSSPTPASFIFTHQWLAANGYAVLVVNPRGAYGFGDAFADHHAGDWGPAASADILACLDHLLAEQPQLDSGRIGIYGGSYGGFMSEYLVTVTDRFAAAVAMYGISDLATYWGQGGWGWTYGDMSVAGVTPWSDPEYYIARSPLFQADRITTPLLLLHGLSDANVTPGESEQLFTALALQDKPVEMVLFPGEDHGISGSFANRVAHRTMMLQWYDRFLRDQPEAWQARWEP